MIDFVAGWVLIPCLIFWSTMAASLMRPSSSSVFLFYTYLFCVCTVVFIAETMGQSDFSRTAYQRILLPLGSAGVVYWLIFNRAQAAALLRTIIKTAAGLDIKVKYVLGFWCVVLLYIGGYIVFTAPGHAPDAKIYHLPGPIMWVVRQSIEAIPHIDLRMNYLPHATEVLYGFYHFVTGSWQGVELINLIVGGMIWPLSLYLLLSAVSLNRSWALLVAMAGATASVNFWQMYAAYVDIHMAVLMTGAMALLIHKNPTPIQTGAAGLAAGLAISVKTMAFLGLVPMGVILVLQAWRHKHGLTRTCCLLCIFYSVIVLAGGAVYFKNWLQFHNPIYPFPLDLKLVVFPGAEFVAKWGTVSRLIEKGTDLADAFYKALLWGFGLLFGCFEYIGKKHPKAGFGFSIEIINYAAVLILGLNLAGPRNSSETNNPLLLEQLRNNTGSMVMSSGLLMVLLGVFLLAFWPWGPGSSTEQFLNIYNALIYSAALAFLVFFSKKMLFEPISEKGLSSDHAYNAGLCIFSVSVFFFLLIKYYSPLGLLNRFAFLLVLIPLTLISLGIQLLNDSARQLLKTGIVFVFVISSFDSLVFKDPRISSDSVFLAPVHKMYNHLQNGTQNMYWRDDRKRAGWERCILPDDVLLVITERAPHSIRYHMPGLRRIVYMAHPAGPYRMDADSDRMPFQIKQRLERAYLSISRKKLRGNYSVGIEYLSYLAEAAGIKKVYAETPVPPQLLPGSWRLLEKTSWGAFYRIVDSDD